MIDRQHSDLVFECDECGNVLESATADFNSAWNQAKREGWRASKVGTEWVHRCPQCNSIAKTERPDWLKGARK